jgi:hypothetical protein
MSNAVDVLCIGGPMNATLVCVPRPGPSLIEFPVATDETAEAVLTYTRRTWEDPVTGKKYHIAAREGDDVTDEQIIIEIVMHNMPPSWDLNPPYTDMVQPA